MKGVRYRAGGERGYCFPVSLLRTEHGPKHFHQGEMPLAHAHPMQRRHVQGVNASGAVWGRVLHGHVPHSAWFAHPPSSPQEFIWSRQGRIVKFIFKICGKTFMFGEEKKMQFELRSN